jgi:hypothetical protein
LLGNSIESQPHPRGPLTTTARPREFWAVIERDGSLVRGRNVLRTEKLDQGIYEVFFTGDVSNAAFVATIGRPGIEPIGNIPPAEAEERYYAILEKPAMAA